MDKEGLIYELSEEQKTFLSNSTKEEKIMEAREDVARLEGYLKGRADSDKSKRGGKGNNSDLAG
jgi:hypothetical protein